MSSIGSAGSTCRDDFVAIEPDTSTRPAAMSSWARSRLSASPRRTSSRSSRRLASGLLGCGLLRRRLLGRRLLLRGRRLLRCSALERRDLLAQRLDVALRREAEGLHLLAHLLADGGEHVLGVLTA